MSEPRRPNLSDRLSSTGTAGLLCLLFLFIGLLYSTTLNSPPFFDDLATFINNPSVYINNISLDSLRQIYNGRFGHHRFLPMLSFAIDQLIGQGQISQFHLSNILIHILATLAIYFLVKGLAKTPVGRKNLALLRPAHFAFFVATLWALHPVQAAGVTYLVQRMASMAALFYFSALAGYVRGRTGQTGLTRATGWAGFLFFMVCAFFSKENTATLPLAVLLVEMIFITPDLGKRLLAACKGRHWLLMGLICLLLLPLATAKMAAISNSYAFRPFTLPERLLTELRVVVFYLSLLALPLPGRFNLDHDFPVSLSLLQPPATMLSLILVVGLLVTAFRYRNKMPLAAFGIFFFFLNLLIESTIIPLELVFEHRLYLPSLGFFIAAVALLDRATKLAATADKYELRTVLFLALLIVSCLLAISTSFRNQPWQTPLTLAEDIVRKSPEKPRVYTNLSKELLKLDRFEEALAVQQRTLALGQGKSEDYIRAANNIVSILVVQHKYQEAADQGEKLLKERPSQKLNFDGFPLLMTNMGIAYWRLGRFADSFEAFLIGVKVHHPERTDILLGGMEAMLLDASTSEEGRSQLDMTAGPETVYLRMATAFFGNKEYALASNYLDRALAIAPNLEKSLEIKEIINGEIARNLLAQAKMAALEKAAPPPGFRSSATFYLADLFAHRYPVLAGLVGPLRKKAMQLAPESPIAALKLARWQLENNESAEALLTAEKLLVKDPANPAFLELAAKCYFVEGKNEAAAARLDKLLAIYPGNPNWRKYRQFILAYNQRPPLPPVTP